MVDRPMQTLGLFAGFLVVPVLLVAVWMRSASESMKAAPEAAAGVAVASAAEDEYCSPKLKQILRRVAGACGLINEGGRGCKPTDAKTVAAMSGADFNALFKPLSHRARIIQFDTEQTVLDQGAMSVIEESWSDQRGASFYFVVARASADGDFEFNQQLSQQRAEAVLKHLETKFNDPDIKSQVGLLWLGEEYAQLSEEFCSWKRSRDGQCSVKDINRSAFVAWIDCAI
jgi:outer membrane protein OmpA-like peptidoglycan-associated protein